MIDLTVAEQMFYYIMQTEKSHLKCIETWHHQFVGEISMTGEKKKAESPNKWSPSPHCGAISSTPWKTDSWKMPDFAWTESAC